MLYLIYNIVDNSQIKLDLNTYIINFSTNIFKIKPFLYKKKEYLLKICNDENYYNNYINNILYNNHYNKNFKLT